MEERRSNAGLRVSSIYSGSISRRKRLGSLRWVRPYSIRVTLLEMYSSFLARVIPT